MRSARTRAALVAGSALVLATAGMLAVRDHLDKAHVTLALLLVVLLGASAGGRAVGTGLATAAFLIFNWFFLPPFHTLTIANPLDWLVLLAFLLTSLVGAELLHRAQRAARVAEARAGDVQRLATAGAESLAAGDANASLRSVLDALRAAVAADALEVRTVDAPERPLAVSTLAGAGDGGGDVSLVQWVLTNGAGAIEQRDGTVHLQGALPTAAELAAQRGGGALAMTFPLRARGRIVGALRLAAPRGLQLDSSRLAYLSAMTFYVALAVERVRLVAEAERVEVLRRSDAVKEALLASVSHDLRTPLTTIKALAHDLGALGDERTAIIEQEADRLNRSVADLLDLSRLRAGAMPARIELNAVDDLVGALLQRVETAIGGGRLDVSLPDALLVGRFDFVHSLRILTNLVENAAKYTDGPIELTARQADQWLDLEVMDRGPGVAEEDRERLFEPFHRGHAVPDGSGSGLGLAIARLLAEAQGGSLTHVDRPGGGSVFRLQLPGASLPPSL